MGLNGMRTGFTGLQMTQRLTFTYLVSLRVLAAEATMLRILEVMAMCYEETVELDLGKFIEALRKAKNKLEEFGKPYRFKIGLFTDPESGGTTWFIRFVIKHDNYDDILRLWDDVSEVFHGELGEKVDLYLELMPHDVNL